MEAEDIKKRWQEYTKELHKKDLNDPGNHNGVITHLEPDILECKVKWALGSIMMSKASGGNGIPVELFQILKDDAVKVLHSICQQIWKTQQWPQDWKRSVFILIPKKSNCAIVWAFFGIAFLWDWNENWSFPVLWPLLFSKFAGILSAALSQHHLLKGFEIGQLEFHHLH